jgi:parallel beta-helix repeat protein
MNGLRYALRLVLCSGVVLVLAPLQVAGGAAANTTLLAVADSYVDSGTPSSNFGTATTIRTDGSPTRTAYLRFNVQGAGGGQPATLRLYAQSSNSTGVQIHGVSNTTWGETTINYTNAPAYGAMVDNSSVQAGQWYNFDVSSLVTGNGLVSFAVTTLSGTAITLSSREGANPPELIIGALPSPSPYLVTRVGSSSTYNAHSQTMGTTFTGSLKSVVEAAVRDLDQTGGGTVTFASGTFDLGSDYFKPENISDIHFEGQGIDQTVIQNSSSIAGDTEPFNFSGATRVTIRDLTVSAGGPFRSTSDAIDFDFGNDSVVERVKITASRGRGIVFDGKNAGWFAENNVVRDCVITSGVPSDGIELLASSRNTVEGCTITGVAGHGIQFAKASTSAPQPNKESNDNVVRNNVVNESGQDGINLNGGDRNRIEGNTITNSSNITGNRDGIRLGTTDGISCNDNIVQGNTATDTQATKTQRYGLAIASSLCNRTVVGPNNFVGNRVGQILDQGTNTQYTGADTQPPTTPTGVAATAISHALVRVTWNASNDNVGVTGYRIYRNGVATPYATVGGSTLTFDDTNVAPSTTYTYTVDAVDAATNASDKSSPPASATTPAAPSAFTFNPVADTYVNEPSPTTNYGTSTQLRIDGSPVLRAYLRFTVQGVVGNVTSAKLRIYANSASSTGHEVHGVADITWGETAINFTDAPAFGGSVGASGAFAAGGYVEVDVTSLISGNGTYSLALIGPGSTAVSYASRESATPPELVVNVG